MFQNYLRNMRNNISIHTSPTKLKSLKVKNRISRDDWQYSVLIQKKISIWNLNDYRTLFFEDVHRVTHTQLVTFLSFISLVSNYAKM